MTARRLVLLAAAWLAAVVLVAVLGIALEWRPQGILDVVIAVLMNGTLFVPPALVAVAFALERNEPPASRALHYSVLAAWFLLIFLTLLLTFR